MTYVDFEEEPGQRSVAKLLTKDEARQSLLGDKANITQMCGEVR